LKKKVYKNNSHTLEELKQNLNLRILKIVEESFQRVAPNMREERIQALLTTVDILNNFFSCTNISLLTNRAYFKKWVA